jgi:hypothetical protein
VWFSVHVNEQENIAWGMLYEMEVKGRESHWAAYLYSLPELDPMYNGVTMWNETQLVELQVR